MDKNVKNTISVQKRNKRKTQNREANEKQPNHRVGFVRHVEL